MEESSGVSELPRAIEAIRSSDVVESRTELILKLGDLDISNKSDLSLLLENLIIFWEDFTCLDVSQCNLNKAILHVASKYLKSDIAGVWAPLLVLGTKASMWSRKHLKMTLMSMEESQEEEHCNIFYQLLMELLSFSAASVSTLTPFSSDEKIPLNVVKTAVLEQLDLTKDALAFIKQEVFQPYCQEVLKIAQMIIDSIVKLCGKYWQYRDSVETEKHPGIDKGNMDCDGVADFNPVIDILKCTIEKLAELGTVAANDGGSLVGVLNMSWKGVVTLLQQGKEELDASLQVSAIILRLISLANNALRCAAESWCSSSKEPISVAEARRTFIPVKFYLVNAVKISTLYPVQAYLVHKDLSECAVKISNLRISMSNEKHLKVASEVASELLEQTTLNLLYSTLNSSEIKQEMKYEILDSLFTDQGDCDTTLHENSSGCNIPIAINDIFSPDAEATRTSCKGRVFLFVCFLRCSHDLEEDAKLGIAKKLRWLFDMLVVEEVYSYILSVQVPLLYRAKENTETIWEPVLFSLMQSLKTFMIVAASSSIVLWKELQSFLLDNFFHPHFLCSEIITELFCFLVRYAEKEVSNAIIDKLFSCFKLMICAESILDPRSASRKTARSICRMASCGTQSLADRVYSHAVGDSRPQLSSLMLVCLLMEGFSIDMLSHKMKEIARKKIITDYYGFIGTFHEKLLGAGGSGLLGAPVFALSACLPSLWAGESDIEEKTMKLLLSITQSCSTGSEDCKSIDSRTKLLAETLMIVSNMKNLYTSDEMEEIVVKLHKMFISKSNPDPPRFCNSKAGLALFVAGLGHMQITDVDESRKSTAICELYHMLLRQRHWALVHLVLTSFGYFAARTSCNQLWRFVPQDAALSYDVSSPNGNEPSEERFMGECKAFLEKEMALKSIALSSDQITQLRKEAAVLRAVVREAEMAVPMECEILDVDREEEASAKRRKVPDGISKGMEMLQSGVKAIHDELSQWQENAPQLQGKFLTHFSCLNDVIMNLASSIAGGD